MIEIIYSLSMILMIAFIFSVLAKLLNQPLIISYIFSGLVIASLKNFSLPYPEIFTLFSQFGIAFLLFIVGLHLNPTVFREVGKASFLVGITQIILTAILSFFVCLKLGFNLISSFYIAAAITFSSTIIVTKILSDKQEIDSLYGKISVGILILQDIVVLLLFIFIPHSTNLIKSSPEFLFFIISLLIFLIIFSMTFLKKIMKFVSNNQELLFLFSLSWCFLLVTLFYKLGLGMEIGALMAGITLSTSPYHLEISSKVKSLRDFFLIIFFINLGLGLGKENIISLIKPALILSAIVIIFKFLIILFMLSILGYTLRTSFFTGIHLGQISEFSFVLAAIGTSMNILSQQVYSMIVFVGLITIFISTYFMYSCEKIYNVLKNPLKIFEKKKNKKLEEEKKIYSYILIGYNRTGFSILKCVEQITNNFIVVDYNPDIIKKLEKRKIPCVYGDINNEEILNRININKAKVIISTVPDFESNLFLIRKIRSENKEAIIIVTARQIQEALELYNKGADYVILPHFLGGKYTAEIIKKAKTSKEKYEEEKKEQLKEILERREEGQEHPSIERG